MEYTTPFLNMCKYNLLNEIIIGIENNPFLINDTDFENNNCLFYAVKFNHIEIVKYLLIKTKIDPNIKNNYGMYCITYALINNNLEIFDFLVNNRFNLNNLFTTDDFGKYPLQYSIYFEQLMKKYLPLKSNVFNDLQIFNYSDFIEISEEKFGNFGNLINIEHNSGKTYVLKKYNYCSEGESQISIDTLKEIYFTKKINELNEKIASKLYGIVIHNNCIYLVFEKLKYTLEKVFLDYLTYSEDIQKLYLKEIFKQLLIYIDNLHSFGILHNDIKSNNFMINNDNYIKIIDFGYSSFFGVGLSNEVYTSYDQYNLNYSDFEDNEIEIKYINKFGELKIHTYKTERKSYVSDVYSLGQMFLNAYFRETNVFMIIDDDIYLSNKFLDFPNYPKNYWIFTKNIWNPVFFDLIKNMLNTNSKFRYNSKDCLKHPFFTNLKQIKKDFVYVNTNMVNNSYSIINTYLLNYYYHYTNEEILNNLFEIPYYYSIHKTYKNEKYFTNDGINSDIFEKIDFIINNNISIDSMLNYIIFLKNNESVNDLYLLEYIFKNFYELTPIDNNYYKIESNLLVANLNKIYINQFMIHINYIFLFLQINKIKIEIIYNIREFIIKYLFLYIIFIKNENYTIWEIISSIYNYYLESNNHNLLNNFIELKNYESIKNNLIKLNINLIPSDYNNLYTFLF